MKSMNDIATEALAELAKVQAAQPNLTQAEAIAWACDGIAEAYELKATFEAQLRLDVTNRVEITAAMVDAQQQHPDAYSCERDNDADDIAAEREAIERDAELEAALETAAEFGSEA